MREIAERYHALGWTPIPLPYGLKGGGGVAWGQITHDTALEYFNGEPQNIGIALGDRSGGLLDVDIDAPDRNAGRIAERFLPPTEYVFGRASKPRSHRFYVDAVSPTPVRRARFVNPVDGSLIAEIRGNGHYTMVEPSLHPTGEFVEGVIADEPLMADHRRLEDGCAALCLAYTMASVWTRQARHDLALPLAGSLKRLGWDRDRATQLVETVCQIAGDEEVADRLTAVATTYEQDRVSGFPSLARAIADAGFDGAHIVREVRRMLRGQADDTPKASAGLSLTDAADLRDQEFPDPVWPVEGLIGGGLSMLVGPPKGGKSFLALQSALAIATGNPMGGVFATNEGSVVYYALEDTLPRLQRRIAKMLGDQPWPRKDRLILVTGTVSGEDEIVAHLLAMIDAHQPMLIIIDTLGMVRNQEEHGSAYLGDYRSISRLKQIADAAGTNLLILHHTRKSATTDDLMTSVSGTYGIAGAADTVLRIRRHGNERRLEVDGRDVEGAKEWSVHFDQDTGSWIVGDEVTDEEDKGSERPLRHREEERRRMRLVSYLLRRSEENPNEWVGKGDIGDNTGVTGGTLNRLLGELAADAMIESRAGKNGGVRWAVDRPETYGQAALP